MKQGVMRALVGFVFLVGISRPCFAVPPSLTGYWVTGKNEAVTQIYSCGVNLLCGEFVGFPMDHASDAMPETWNNQAQCHFVFIRDLRDEGDTWKGTIINPQSGNNYSAAVKLVSPNQLKLRGYLLLQIFGASRLWSRYQGPPPPADCRMSPHSLG